MASLLEKTRSINELLQQSNVVREDKTFPYNRMADILSDILDSNAYIIHKDGEVLGYKVKHDINNERVKKMLEQQQFPNSYIDQVARLTKTEANITVDNDLTVFPIELKEMLDEAFTTLVPIYGAGEYLGTIALGRIGKTFSDNDLILAEYSATVVGMQILYQESRNVEAEIRSQTAVQMAISTLSYSELKAVKAIFEALDGEEGRLTASTIADRIGITRSVIVNALRKLESASVIESRSLGMKGTYIRILNRHFMKELDKETVL